MKTPAISKTKLLPLLSKVWNDAGYTGSLPPLFAWSCRGYYGDTFAPAGNNIGINDDAIGVISDQVDYRVQANVDPSRSRTGVSALKAPQVIWYRPGWHGFASVHGHPAFRQDSSVVVKRTGTESWKKGAKHKNFGVCLGNGYWTDAGFDSKFWTNLHRQTGSGTSSLGCQTIPAATWKAFHSVTSAELKRLNLERFPCILLDGPIN
jgi:lysozyme